MSRVWAFTECVRSTIAQWAVALSLVSAAINGGISAQAQESVRRGVEEVGSDGIEELRHPSSSGISPELTPLQPSPYQGEGAAIAIPQLTEFDRPATTVADWLAQIEAALVQITGVRVEETEIGLRVLLETANGSLDLPETRSIGNALIADIPNATIAEEFSQANPIAGIALVNVTNLPGDRVRVAITGTDTPPVAEVRAEAQGLVLNVALGKVPEEESAQEEIEIVVTGEQDEGYNPSSASTATRTDTPLRNIPQTIRVVPQEVLRDQNITRLE
ncbi:MAG: AMIN domain-containing protein, partial [Microcoleus sp. SIO2G3]|nr:AMIN domain-containing protein [Microcoleus sp. SIO2G3]